jgi:Galactose-3-O-sulfotransferase
MPPFTAAAHAAIPRSKPVASTDSPGDLVIFLHLPRSSGATLNRIIAQQFPPEAIVKVGGKSRAATHAAIAAVSGARAITGHYSYGLHEAVARPSTYITIMREPVKRFVSHFYSAKYNPRHHLHELVSSGELTMRDAAPLLANIVTRYIAGDAVEVTAETADHSTLEVAKQNLERHFSVVGIAERFDESLVLLQRRLGWKVRAFTDANVNRSRGEADQPTAEEIEAILQSNQLDRELYGWARERLNREVEAGGAEFQRELARLQRRKKFYRWWSAAKQSLRVRKKAVAA